MLCGGSQWGFLLGAWARRGSSRTFDGEPQCGVLELLLRCVDQNVGGIEKVCSVNDFVSEVCYIMLDICESWVIMFDMHKPRCGFHTPKPGLLTFKNRTSRHSWDHRKKTRRRLNAKESDETEGPSNKSQTTGLKTAFQLISDHAEFGFDFRTPPKKPAEPPKHKYDLVRLKISVHEYMRYCLLCYRWIYVLQCITLWWSENCSHRMFDTSMKIVMMAYWTCWLTNLE